MGILTASDSIVQSCRLDGSDTQTVISKKGLSTPPSN